ncbi:hypothetical protein [Burkholderia cenocepacia]|uniref:hypothetical protein n=1 Tax=Burkholderia cenocepacia TaxID=95486 RepID=UPI000ABED723|nr:hypothetical protein [Burkholderia cenocepacia]
MSPEQKRKFNTAFGGFFFASGIAAWALAAYFAFTPNPPKPAPSFAGTVVDLNSCSRALRNLGYPDVTVEKDEITAHEPMGADPKGQLDRATIGATMCKLEMKSFCMGEACTHPGVTLVVTKPASARTEPAAAASNVAASGASAAAASAPKPAEKSGT